RHYDIVLLDAYYADAVPFHLTTREFFLTVNQKLTNDGTAVINIIGAVTGPKSRIVRSFFKTLQQIFPQIYLFPTLGSDDHSLWTSQNIIILASKNPKRVDIEEIVRRAASLGRDLFPQPLSNINAAYLKEMPEQDGDVPILTDDYAPTDSLLQNY
ncbi:MAG TPA: fused MFS/spermidine synthase, partial [Candidatus Binatia bacterium]